MNSSRVTFEKERVQLEAAIYKLPRYSPRLSSRTRARAPVSFFFFFFSFFLDHSIISQSRENRFAMKIKFRALWQFPLYFWANFFVGETISQQSKVSSATGDELESGSNVRAGT